MSDTHARDSDAPQDGRTGPESDVSRRAPTQGPLQRPAHRRPRPDTLAATGQSSPRAHVPASGSPVPPMSARETHLRDHLALALVAGGLGAWEWDVTHDRVTWDATLESIYGLEPGQFDGSHSSYSAMIHPEDREAATRRSADARAAGRPFEVEHRIIRADGAVRWTHGWAQPLFDDEGHLISFIGVVADVTDRRDDIELRDRALAAETAARTEAELAVQRYADVAETLQRSLLPPVPPEIPGLDIATCYHPALDGLAVGGDFYDIARTGRNTWVLMLGDVCGKGAAAAALTGLVRYSARTAAMQGGGPAAVLRQVNEVLRRDRLDEPDVRFATMTFARLRPRQASLDITFANGGHPNPYVLRRDGTVETPGSSGTLLGVLTDAAFSNTTTKLGPGDTFIVLTDGVLEARDASDVEFGDHLPALLTTLNNAPAGAIAGAIEHVALDWQGGTPRDDIAIVAIRVPDVA